MATAMDESRKEFPGTDADFGRLDRDHDKALTKTDFDFSQHALTMSPGAMLFMRADRDGNGKVTRDEIDAFFNNCDSGDQEFLSLSDLQDAFRMPAARPVQSGARSGPTPETLIRGLFHQEIGSLQPGPALGESAPGFALKTFDGKEELTLSKLIGPRPVVLVFGNFTCGPFRSQSGNVEKLYRMYKDRATFLMIYVREAHPTDGWSMESNNRVGISLAQPQTYEERVSVAETCGKRLGLGFPMLVDKIDDAVGARYSGMPSRLYLIDRQNKIAYKSGRGPFGFKPAELEHSLVLLLQEEEAARAATGRQARVGAPSGGQRRPEMPGATRQTSTPARNDQPMFEGAAFEQTSARFFAEQPRRVADHQAFRKLRQAADRLHFPTHLHSPMNSQVFMSTATSTRRRSVSARRPR